MTTGKRTTSLVVLLVALTCSMLAVHSRSTRAQTGEPYEIVATHNVMVAVRDGVRLATDVYSPGRGGITTGRFPTIVERTPYNKDSIAADSTGYFVPRGYVVVLQDVRGRYRSEGTWRPIRDDRPDGAELLKWITEQPWSNGKVGTVKASPAPTRYSFDPHNPVPTIGGNVSSEGVLMPRGAQDQRCYPEHWLCKDTLPLSARQDVVVFQTPPLQGDVEVTGRLVVTLRASSKAPDTDFTAKLIDVYQPSRDFPSNEIFAEAGAG
jgi:predicted acyl esterase